MLLFQHHVQREFHSLPKGLGRSKVVCRMQHCLPNGIEAQRDQAQLLGIVSSRILLLSSTWFSDPSSPTCPLEDMLSAEEIRNINTTGLFFWNGCHSALFPLPFQCPCFARLILARERRTLCDRSLLSTPPQRRTYGPPDSSHSVTSPCDRNGRTPSQRSLSCTLHQFRNLSCVHIRWISPTQLLKLSNSTLGLSA